MAGPWYIVVNGSEVDIDTTYGTYTTGMTGFGMPPLTHNVYNQALTPGAALQNVKVQPRVLQLEIGCRGVTLAAYHSLRKLLVEACKPNYGGTLTAVELRYDGAGTKVKVFGYYDSGLQGQRAAGAKTPEKIALRFICYDPWFYAMSTTTVSLSRYALISNADYAMRRISGVWANISTDFNAAVYAINRDLSGIIYLGGGFTDVGDGNGDYIVKWNPANETLASILTGLNGTVYAIARATDNGVYIGGSFTDAGDANGDRIVKWSGSAWASLSTGIGNGTVRALAVGQDGTIYAGGTFTNHVDANGDYISQLSDPTASPWASMGTGMDEQVLALAVGIDGTLYAGGAFSAAGGVAAVRIAKWNGTAWSAVGSGVGMDGMFDVVYAIAVGPDGSVYVGGTFDSVDGIAAAGIAKWNGRTWEALGAGVAGSVYTLAIGVNGELYVGGSFTAAGGVTIADNAAVWNGSTWSPIDVTLPGSPIIQSLFLTNADADLYIGYDTHGSAVAAEQTTVTNSGTTIAYPVITIKRVGGTTVIVDYLKNETTSKKIHVNYSLLDGETLTINLTPGAKSMTSDFFGNVIGRALLPNSDFAEWCLTPGDNIISLYDLEVDSPTVTASCAFVAAHWSVDGVAA